MSRIGKLPVVIPAGVKISVAPGIVTVEGPKGKLDQKYNNLVKIEAGKEVIVTPVDDSKEANAAQGLYRNLINNMVIGVTTGYTKSLIVNGVGFRAEVQGKVIMMNLGFSNDFYVTIPDNISVTVEAQNKLIITSTSKEAVGEFAAEIRRLRKPEPYKGKGIRYETETIKRKVGKSGVK